jgi:predicted peptidase
MTRLSLFLVSAILLAQSPTGIVKVSDARRLSAKKLRQRLEAIADRFEPHTFMGTNGHLMPYRLFRPRTVPALRTYPLVVFLHGSGGIGTDNNKQFTGGNLVGSRVWALDANQGRQAALLSSLNQIGDGLRGSMPKRAESSDGTPGIDLLFELLDSILPALPIDRRRIYLTGQSLGGYGTFA